MTKPVNMKYLTVQIIVMQPGELHTVMADLGQKWVIFASNGTNPGLLNIVFQIYFLSLSGSKCTEI